MPTNKELEAKLSKLTDVVMGLAESLPKKEEKEVEEPEKPLEVNQSPYYWGQSVSFDKIDRVLGGKSSPIPQEYVSAVHEILNHKFGTHLVPTKGLPTFKFTILVPKEYSVEPDYDVRPKVLSYSDGEQGVRAWCERVLSSFSEEFRNQIVSERKLAQRPLE